MVMYVLLQERLLLSDLIISLRKANIKTVNPLLSYRKEGLTVKGLFLTLFFSQLFLTKYDK